MPRRLRLLWVVPHLPRRGISAARERWWHLLARLAPRHDLTLLALVDPEDVGKEAGLPPGISAVRQVAKQPAIPDDPLALLPHLARWQFADPRLAAAVAAEVDAVPYDLVQFEYQDLAHLIPATPCPTILTVHQLGFAAWGPAWRATGRGARRGLVALYRHLRDLDFELRAVERVDHVITMTPEDAARLRRFRPSLAVSVSPVGVDCREFSPAAAEASSPESDLLFVGNFDHAPNVDAVRFLVDAILPRVGRPLQLRLVGRRTPPEIRAVARTGSIDVVSDVDDVRPHLARAAAVVAPVRFGTGMRGKVLEALAMARPVVTTSVGAEGLGATSGEHLLVADSADAFAQAIRHVLDDRIFATRLGAAGRALVEHRFDWDRIAEAHEAIYDEVLRSHRIRPVAHSDTTANVLARFVAPLGSTPGIATGAILLTARGAGWHLRRLRTRVG